MQVIKVDAIDSTNTFLRNLNRDRLRMSPVCVIAKSQYAGKGQMGTTWQSEPGENLICSIFMPISGITLQQQFYVSMAASLAVSDALMGLAVPQIAIKWPNDILSEKKKVCGILIENTVNNGSLVGAIVGIGLNVNQVEFPDLPKAGSLQLSLQQSLSVKEVFKLVLRHIEARFELLNQGKLSVLKSDYEVLLFRKDKPSTFSDELGCLFTGIIKEVSDQGKLVVLLEDDILKSYDLKQLKLLY